VNAVKNVIRKQAVAVRERKGVVQLQKRRCIKITVFWDVILCSLVRSTNIRSLFDSEDGGSRFLRNVRTYLPEYVASNPRRPPWEHKPSEDNTEVIQILKMSAGKRNRSVRVSDNQVSCDIHVIKGVRCDKESETIQLACYT
jgi:hypothetical protein